MSAVPRKLTLRQGGCHVCFVPNADILKRRTAIRWYDWDVDAVQWATSSSLCLSGEAFRERLSKTRRISFTDY